ncbi:hypothetical protein C4A74_00003 [Escherichia coli]|nr:hypothetical protein C4A74_00003 [Escherichia coli]
MAPATTTGVLTGNASSSPPDNVRLNGDTTLFSAPPAFRVLAAAVTGESPSAFTTSVTRSTVALTWLCSSVPSVIVRVVPFSEATVCAFCSVAATATTEILLPTRPSCFAVKSSAVPSSQEPAVPEAHTPPEASGAVPTRPITAVEMVCTATVPVVSSMVSTPCNPDIHFSHKKTALRRSDD